MEKSMHTTIVSNQCIETKVVGVTYEGRQAVVAQLTVGEVVSLVRDPLNQFDSNAIMVIRQNGQQIGFLNRDLAAMLSARMDRLGRLVKATISAISGGLYIDSSLGVRVKFDLPD
jgi:single-stranded-DNA-specific exonuclease